MSDRAVSTVLDVSVSLLLVGAAITTLLTATTTGADPAAGRAEEVATTLAGSTATVSYVDGGEVRTAHGTRAGLLADAAVSNRTRRTGGQFRSAVANATEPALVDREWRAQVVATWRPFDGADEIAVARVGGSPPAGVDVHVATMTVPSGLDPVREDAVDAADREGFGGVADILVASLVHSTEDRRSASERRIEITAELESTFESPGAAARAVSVGRVHVTVRTWST